MDTDLATLSDTDSVTPSDTIRLNASDTFGNTAVTQTIDVTVTPTTGETFILTKGVDHIRGGSGNNTIIAASQTLSRGNVIDGGVGGTNIRMRIMAGTEGPEADRRSA